MKQNWIEIITGGAVLLVAVLFFAFAFRTSGGQTGGGRYELGASFNSAEGIAVGGDVRMAGVKIGSVSVMDLNTESFMAELTLSLNDNVQIPADSEIKVSSDGLLGGAFVEILPGADDIMLASGDTFIYTSGAVSLLTLFASFAAGSGN